MKRYYLLSIVFFLALLPSYSEAAVIYESFDVSLATTTVPQGIGNAPRRQKIQGSIESATGLKYARVIMIDKGDGSHSWTFTLSSCAFSDCSGPAPTVIASSDAFSLTPNATTTLDLQMTSGENTPLTAGTTYRFDITRTTGDAYVASTIGTMTLNYGCGSTCTGSPGAAYVVLYDSAPPVENTDTRIIITDPYDEETVATSTSFVLGAQGYVNPEDYESGMYLYIRTAPYASSQASVANPDLLIENFSIPITSSGSFNLSTTTSITSKGRYFMETSIRTPSIANTVLNFLGFGQFATFGVLTSTSTNYTAGEPNQFDNLVSSTTQSINDYIASSTISVSSCTSWTEFNLLTCLNLLFVPQMEPIMNALGDFKNGFLSYFPWGYLTRFVVIMSGNATTTLPTFTATIPISPSTSMDIITLDMQEMIEGGGEAVNTIQDPYSGETLQEIIQPWVRLFIAISILFIIIADVAGMGHHTDGKRRV